MSRNMSIFFSSKRQDWPTPWELFRHWDDLQGPFELDVCAFPHNSKCSTFYTPEQDGLSMPWFGVCWCNPPYGKVLNQWIKKAVDEVRSGRAKRVVCLLPARTDTAWWHDYVLPYGEIHFLRGRVRFEGATHSAPFANVIVIFQ